MNCVLISIGDELLIGQTINTNAAWLGEQLNLLGFILDSQCCSPKWKQLTKTKNNSAKEGKKKNKKPPMSTVRK